MRRHNERPQPTRRRTLHTGHGGTRARGLTSPRLLRAGAVVCLTLFLLPALAERAHGQEKWPQSITIDTSKPLKEPARYVGPAGVRLPQGNTELVFKGNGGDWSFVKFDKLPLNVTLKVSGNINGYQPSEALRPEEQNWYPFKSRLPLILEIGQGAITPVEVKFWFGSPNTDAGREAFRSTKDIDEARRLAQDNEIKSVTDLQVLSFLWEGQAASGTSPSPSATAQTNSTNIVEAPNNSSWWTYLTEENPILGIVILIIVLALLTAAVLFGIQYFVEGRDRSLPPKRSRSSPLDSLDLAESKRASNGQAKSVTPAAKAATQAEQEKQRDAAAGGDDDTVIKKPAAPAEPERPGRSSDTATGRPGELFRSTTTPVGQQDGQSLTRLDASLRELQGLLAQKVGSDDRLTKPARTEVESLVSESKTELIQRIGRVEANLSQKVADEIKVLEGLLSQQELRLNQKSKDTENDLKRLAGEGAEAQRQLVELQQELGRVEGRLEASIAELRASVNRQAVPDSFYAKTLGAILGQNIETLQDGNFERLMGERLNQFFQTGVSHGVGLQELRVRAEGINNALKGVSAQIEKLNAQAAAEARPHLQRVQAFVDELGGLQSQLQTRRATIETKLSIPVSMHAGARQTFLDELGRGIKREIDKLNEPESYFKGELERLITAELIPVVDICDSKKVAPPPSNQRELEGALNQLFEQAGLRPILPSRGEPFKTAEQDLIEMVQGGGGQSLTVQQVSRRGFYYKQDDAETLLRKASVTVHR